MILVVAATETEMRPFQYICKAEGLECEMLVSGIGPLETAVNLTKFISDYKNDISLVINFGVAGGYINEGIIDKLSILDLCIAEKEYFGDLGICLPENVGSINKEVDSKSCFAIDRIWLEQAKNIIYAECEKEEINCFCGGFVTVSCVSATEERGSNLSNQYNAICENMEGAAAARVCQEFSLPFVEIRAISNLVEDRDIEQWKITEAADIAAKATAWLVVAFEGSS